MKRVLILGGTGDATELAAITSTIPGVEVISSLAGRTSQPLYPNGTVRVGGFGGEIGLYEYLREQQINVLIDATHPFATQISLNAAAAATEIGLPRLMLVRQVWEKVIGDDWLEVNSVESAATALKNLGKRVFLTVGRQQLAAFAHLDDIWFLIRLIERPATDAIVPKGKFLCDRGPFTLDNERRILQEYNIDTIVSKNSGGQATYAKILAARELGMKVVMIQRPAIPPGEEVADVDSAVAWLKQKLNV